LRYVRFSLIRQRVERRSRLANAASSTVTAFRWLKGPGRFAAWGRNPYPSMLPGFRFLFAAIVLSASILVFGLGAAALLRASHEQYVSNPAWRNGPQEKVFAQAAEPAMPVLATLRAEPDFTAAPTLRDQIPTIALPETDPAPVAVAPDAQPETVALTTEAAPAELAEPAAVAQPAPEAGAPPAMADTLTPADATVVLPADRSIAVKTTLGAASPVPDLRAARVAALNDLTPPASSPRAKAKADGGSDAKAAKPRAHRVKKRRRIVRRPPPAQVQQQATDPFSQQQLQPGFAVTNTTRTR
jgi:hypothetical protein